MSEFVWVETYRPRTIEDTIMPDNLKTLFKNFASDPNNIPHLILEGPAGVGKTSIARALLDEIGASYMMINASKDGNIDTLRVKITNYAASLSLTGGRKFIILDEADYLNANSTQPALRSFMEEFSKNCGFILTCNYKNRLMPAIHSRCTTVSFRFSKEQKSKMAQQFFKSLCNILTTEKVPFEKEAVAEFVKKYFPDMRRALNELQRYVKEVGRIDTGIISNMKEANIKELLSFLKVKDFTSVRKWVAENTDMDVPAFYRMMYDTASKEMTPKGIAQLILILAKYQYQAAFVVDQDINTAACLVEVMVECDWK